MCITKWSLKYSAYNLVWGDVHSKVVSEILSIQPCVGEDVHYKVVG